MGVGCNTYNAKSSSLLDVSATTLTATTAPFIRVSLLGIKTMQYTRAFIADKMAHDLHWLERGILATYRYQTVEEQDTKQTKESNKVGFNGADAPFLSSLAEWLQSGRHLTEKQMYVARRKMFKYAGQLERIANTKQ